MSNSTRRALRVLETIGGASAPIGVTEIARRLGIAAGTVFRSLDALERSDYIARHQASSRYVIGSMVSRLRQSVLASYAVRDIALPYLRQLAFASGETTSLCVRLGWYALRIAAAPGTNDVTSSPPLGETRPLGAGAAGNAILAFLPAPAVARYRDWAERQELVPGGAPDGDLATIRERGYALEATPFAAGRASLALPVRGASGVIAAIAIEGPVLALDTPESHPDLRRWIEIVATLENIACRRPELFGDPYAHLDPDDIVIASPAAASGA